MAIATKRNITESKQAEEALQESEEKYKILAEDAPIGIYFNDFRGTFLYGNKKAEEIIGYKREELLGKSFLKLKLLDPKGVGKAIKLLALSKLGKATGPDFFVLKRKDGTKSIVEIRTKLTSVGGKKVVLGMVEDITERKKAEQALADEATRRRILIDQSRDGIVILDQNGKVYEANKRFAEMLGYTPEEAAELHMWDWDTQWPREKLLEMVRSVDEAGDHFETYHRRKDGTTIDVEISTNGAVCAGQKLVFCVCRDITERKRLEQEREQLLRNLEDKTKELGQIIYVTSHDLRSPLVNIQGFTRELEQSLKEVRSATQGGDIPPTVAEKLAVPMDEDIPTALKYILASTSKIDLLLSGLLRLSRLGRAALVVKNLNMNELMADIIHAFEFNIKEAEVTLEVEGLPSCRGDNTQINQVFSNLIDNALKFLDPSRPGIIRVSGRKEDSQVIFCVEDNGIGIEPEHYGKVFEIFQRLDPGSSSGEGLGLTIVRRILDRHYGKIWLESELGKGSKFFVSLPAA